MSRKLDKRDFSEIARIIIKHIKDRDELKLLPTYKQAATELGVSYDIFKNAKRRNTSFHVFVMDYCVREGLDIVDVFYKNV